MQKCSSCNLPETHETISFNKKKVCNICTNHSEKKENIDWNSRKKELDKIIKDHKGKFDYDCIIPFSGGKDSTWAAYYLVKEFNIKPLLVRFDHGFMRPNLEKNVKKITRELGVEILTFTPNWKVVQKLMLKSFLEKGDFCWHCHTGIYSYPMWIAVEKKIPLIFWGESPDEYTAYTQYNENQIYDEKMFNRYINLGITANDMLFRFNGEIDSRDLKPYTYPPVSELNKINYKSLALGNYMAWDTKKQSKIIADELGWNGDEVENVPPEYSYEKIECQMQGVRDYIKFIKRGYSRVSHLVALDRRNNRITLKEGIEKIELFEGKRPASLDLFLNFVGLSEKQFLEIALSHQISPYKHDAKLTTNSKKTHDYDQWSTDGSMDKKISKKILANWEKNNKA
jgi:N-acetyl sugar amidotransferase